MPRYPRDIEAQLQEATQRMAASPRLYRSRRSASPAQRSNRNDAREAMRLSRDSGVSLKKAWSLVKDMKRRQKRFESRQRR